MNLLFSSLANYSLNVLSGYTGIYNFKKIRQITSSMSPLFININW